MRLPGGDGGIFISYRREETAAQAGRLYDRLSDHFGEDRVFMDVDSIAIGVDFSLAIRDALSSCNILLALIGHDWSVITDKRGIRRIDSPGDYVRVEIETALARDIRVVPILVDGATLPRPDDLPPSLHPLMRRQALELSHIGFRSEVARLITAIDSIFTTHRGRADPPSEVPTDFVRTRWRAEVRFIRKGATVIDTEILIKLTHEDHKLVARWAWTDNLQLDGKKIASSWNNLDGGHAFSLSDGPRQLAAQVELQRFTEKIPQYYRVSQLVVEGQEVPLFEHPS